MDPDGSSGGSLRIYGAREMIGDTSSALLEIVEITPDGGPPGPPGRERSCGSSSS